MDKNRPAYREILCYTEAEVDLRIRQFLHECVDRPFFSIDVKRLSGYRLVSILDLKKEPTFT